MPVVVLVVVVALVLVVVLVRADVLAKQPRHVVVMVLVLLVEHHVKVARDNPSHGPAAHADLEPGNRKRRQRLAQTTLVAPKVEQRSDQHVSRDAATALQIEGPAHPCLQTPKLPQHSIPEPSRASATKPLPAPHRTPTWSMRAAWQPAPKPLSMLTTETPLAQLLSMARSAATPPSDAP